MSETEVTVDQSIANEEPVTVVAYTDFRHDCSSFPDGFEHFPQFVQGREYVVPASIADYFIRAGWCAMPGEEPIKVDPNKQVLVNPESVSIGTETREK